MPFCRYCGAEKVDENAECTRCAGQYYQQAPPMAYPMPPQKDDAGRVLGIIAIVIVVIIIVTVVLAAVLYVMVIGFDGGGEYSSTPVGAWMDVRATSSTSIELKYGAFASDVAPADLKIFVMENGTPIGNLMMDSGPSSMNTFMEWVDGPAGATATYIDYNYVGNTVNAGDHIIINGLKPGTEYSFEVFHVPTDTLVSMVGASPTVDT